MSLVRRVRGLKIPRRLVLTTGNSVNRFPRLLVYRHLKLPMFSTSFRTPTLQNSRQYWQSFQSNSTRYWWNWWQRFSARIVKSVNRRCLLCAGAIFLWDRERVTNQEISKSLSKYERRINGKMQSLKESIGPTVDEEAAKGPDESPNNNNNGDNVPTDNTSKPATLSDEQGKNEQSAEEKTVKKPKERRSYRQTPKKKPSMKQKKSKKVTEKQSKEENEPKTTNDTTSPSLNKEEVNTTNTIVTDNTSNDSSNIITVEENTDPMKEWVLMSEQEHCKVYSKPYGASGLSQYKAVGFYKDITARDFLDVQIGDDRSSWDSYCLSLKTVDHDSSTGSEIIHWVVKFPFPMSDRDYVFVRRHWISPNDDAVVVISRSVEHPAVPVTRKYIRVKTFFSELVLKPVTFIDEVGFHFELTYFDDPGSNIPSSAMSWATKSALPDFLNKIYQAVLRKQVSDRHKHHLA